MKTLEQLLAKHKDKTIAIALHDRETGQRLHIRADQAFHPASTIKVHVMMAVFRQAEQGLLRLDDRLPVINSFTSIADASHFSLFERDDSEKTLYTCIGQSISIRELMRLMIVRSSNLATNVLVEKVGAQNVNALIRELGIPGVTFLRGIEDNAAHRLGLDNSATARGLTETMKRIAEGYVVSKQACEEMVAILLGQELNQSIPALLPASVKVAHKTGWNDDVFHDTGLVYLPGRQPYALSIMTRGFFEAQEDEAHACMAAISRVIYEMIH